VEAAIDPRCFPTKDEVPDEWGALDDPFSKFKNDQRDWLRIWTEMKRYRTAVVIQAAGADDLSEQVFQDLRDSWHREYGLSSSGTQIMRCPSYKQIVAYGSKSLPFIFRDLERRPEPDFWFDALAQITKDNPVPDRDRGYSRRMAKIWLKWWRQNKDRYA
jgi:hypothetical protein